MELVAAWSSVGASSWTSLSMGNSIVLIVAVVIVVAAARGLRSGNSAAAAARRRWVKFAARAVDLLIVFTGLAMAFAVAGLLFGGSAVGNDAVSIGHDGIEAVIRSGPSFGGQDLSAYNGDRATDPYVQTFGVHATPVGHTPTVQLWAPHPSIGAWVVAGLGGLSVYVGLFGFLWFLGKILRGAERGEPFGAGSVNALRWMTIALVVYGLGPNLANYLVGGMLIHEGGGTGSVQATWTVTPLVAAALLLALAEVWQYGLALQRDVEATV